MTRGSAVEGIDDAQRSARRPVHNPWVERYARFGYIAKGIVSLVMGWLAAKAAVGLQDVVGAITISRTTGRHGVSGDGESAGATVAGVDLTRTRWTGCLRPPWSVGSER
jgi:hypothetical protein